MHAEALFMFGLMALIGVSIAVATLFERRRARQIHQSLMQRWRRIRRVGDRARRQ